MFRKGQSIGEYAVEVDRWNRKQKDDVRFRKSDEEFRIKECTLADGTFMKAPNGQPTNLNERQWLQVRTKAFKEWFGDWEKAARIEKLRGAKPVEITGKEVELSDDLKQYKKNALAYGKKLQGIYVNKDTGKEIQLQRGRKNGGINEVLQHDYKNSEHLQSIAAIPGIIENSIYMDSQDNTDLSKNNGVREYQYYACGLKIGGEDYTVRATIAVDSRGDRYYDHKLTQVEKGKLLDLIENQAALNDGFGTTPDTKSTTTFSVYKDTKLISLLQSDSSKVVDENGEPMVVYNGTDTDFTEFKFNKIGSNATSLGYGFYLASSKDVASGYSKTGNIMSLFLKSKKQLDINEKPLTEKELTNLINKVIEKEIQTNEIEDYKDSFISNYVDTYSLKKDKAIKEVVRMILESNESAVYQISEISNVVGDKRLVNEAVVESLGYDTIIQKDFQEDGVAFVALTPSQIKSATDNTGAFDEKNDDIRFRESDEKPVYWKGQPIGEYAGEVNKWNDSMRFRVDVPSKDRIPQTPVFTKRTPVSEIARLVAEYRKAKPVEITGKEYKGKYELNRESAKAYIYERNIQKEMRGVILSKIGSQSMGNKGRFIF